MLNSQICKHDFELSHRQFCESLPIEAQMLHSEMEPLPSFHQPLPSQQVLRDSSGDGLLAQ